LRTQAEEYTTESREASSTLNKASTEAVRERVKAAEKVKSDLEEALAGVEKEMEHLDENIGQLAEVTDFEQRASDETRKVLRERRSRAGRPGPANQRYGDDKDDVDHALRAFNEDIRGSLFPQLTVDCKKYRRNLNKLRPNLDHNIEVKTEAARVDMQCLNVQPSPRGRGASPRTLSPMSPSKKGSPSGRGRQTTPTLWQSSADGMSQHATMRVSQSVQLRKKLEIYRDRRVSATLETLLQGRVVSALERKLEQMTEERDGPGGLAECLDEVRADMASNKDSLEELKSAIAQHSTALEVAQTRLRTRETKPDGERVRDQANLALEEEEEHLMRTITKLHIQRKRVTSNFERLLVSERELERAIGEKEGAIEMDQRILDLMNELAEELGVVLEGITAVEE